MKTLPPSSLAWLRSSLPQWLAILPVACEVFQMFYISQANIGPVLHKCYTHLHFFLTWQYKIILMSSTLGINVPKGIFIIT